MLEQSKSNVEFHLQSKCHAPEDDLKKHGGEEKSKKKRCSEDPGINQSAKSQCHLESRCCDPIYRPNDTNKISTFSIIPFQMQLNLLESSFRDRKSVV